MSLVDLKLKKIYRTKQDNVVDQFLAPALKESSTYDRGSGFFTLNSLSELADGIIPFIQHNGVMRVITSVQLSDEDVEIIKKGILLKDQNISNKIRERIEKDIATDEQLLKLDLITNLIAANILEIRIAYMPDGIYHEKIGILTDKDNSSLYFSGSNNETVSGLNKNWETIMLLTSWWGDEELIQEQKVYFEELWNNKVNGLEVMPFPEAEEKDLIKKYKISPDVKAAISRIQKNSVETKKKKKEPHDYQKIAMKQFVNNCGCHFFEMATGTGKTFTAVKATIELLKQVQKLSVIVLVPQVDLQSQWSRAFDEEEVRVAYLGGLANANETKYNWGSFLINAYDDDGINVVISTYDTFFGKIINQCKAISDQTLLIVDEAHNLSPNQIRMLPEGIKYRLGLSATPERYSQTETEKIISYFTRDKIETYKYTIEEAIDNGFLSHYLYYPVFSNLSDDEFRAYQNYTRQVIVAYNQEPRDDAKIKDILTKRSSIVKKSSSKLSKLQEMVLGKSSRKFEFINSVVYCGHGKDYDTEESIIDSVTRILSKDGAYSVSQFTSKTADRAIVLREFEDGNYDVLAAIKCFDEGVDVPKLDKIYIMASDALNRQTIQRRGRVLRTCSETGKKIAYIFDFVSLPPLTVTEGVGMSNLVVNEMKRAKEYARLADNKDDIRTEITDILSSYGVSEEDLDNEFNEES